MKQTKYLFFPVSVMSSFAIKGKMVVFDDINGLNKDMFFLGTLFDAWVNGR